MRCSAWCWPGGLPGSVLSADPSDIPERHLWDTYKTAACLWGAATGTTGLVLLLTSGRRPARQTVGRLAACVAAMVLAALWPGQALLLGLLYARRAAGLPRRLTGLTAGGLALVLGGFWGTNGYERGQLLALAPTDSAGVSLGGEWHTSDGRHLHLGADGTFTVTGAPRELFDAGADLGGRIDATGTWESNGSGFVSNVVAVDLSPEPGSPADRLTDGFPSILTLYKIGSTPLLCVDSDDDSLCDYVYRH